MRPCHQQQSWQPVEKDRSDPAWHAVSPWCFEVPVDDNHCDEDGDDVHKERKEKILGNERNGEGSGR